jgi:hypothetical protein
LIEYADKMLKRRGRTCLRHHHGKIAAVALSKEGGSASLRKSVETKR